MNMKASSIFLLAVILMLSAVSAHANCANLPGLRLTAKENHLSLNDNTPICVTLEDDGTIDFTFRITIANPVEVDSGDVVVRQKDSSPQPKVTIQGNNASPSNKVTVRVTGSAQLEDLFDFLIEVEGIGLLDPKVRVVNSQVQRSLQVDSFQEVASAWALEPREIDELADMVETE
jgi:hypothetical protein